MGDMSELQEREDKLQGMGTSLLRKEDANFIRGQGSYVDDIKLPGMLFGALVRSPYAHARIKGIDKSKALACPGVVAVLTADDLKPVNLHWMPTLGGDVQAVLADKKVCFQMQEVAMVLATDRYAAADGAALVEVDYEELPAIVDPKQSMDKDAVVIREDIADKTEVGHGPRTHPNHIFTWEAGDKAAGRRRLRRRRGDGARGDPQPARAPLPAGNLRLRRQLQQGHRLPDGVHDDAGAAPRAHRAGHAVGRGGKQDPRGRRRHRRRLRQQGAGVPGLRRGHRRQHRHRRAGQVDRIAHRQHLAPPASPATTTASANWRPTPTASSRACASPRWPTTARSTRTSRRPSSRPGCSRICTGSYAIPNAYCRVDAVYTNKAPGGVAYRCSLRVTEAIYLIERMIDVLAQKLGIDKAEIRRRNFVKDEQFPYTTPFGWTLDSGAYGTALDKVLKAVDYDGLRREQAAKRADPNCPTLMGIGLATFTEIVGAGPTKVCDILGIGLFDSCEIRVHPTGGVIARLGTMTQGQGHATTYAQIIATELGLPASDIVVEEGDTDKAPYGAGTWGTRSTPVSARPPPRRRARSRTRRRRSPPTCSKWPKATSNGRSTASRSRATPSRPRP